MGSQVVGVLLFGPARDAAGGRSVINLEFTENDVHLARVRKIIQESYPELRLLLESSIFAVDNRMVPKSKESTTSIIPGQTEIVLVPPVSGG